MTEELPETIREVFKTAPEIDQTWVINLAAQRQEFIDQGQSINLFFTPDVDVKYLHGCHFLAWKNGLKSLYYCRSDKLRKADSVSTKIKRNRIEEGDSYTMQQLAQENKEEDSCVACEG